MICRYIFLCLLAIPLAGVCFAQTLGDSLKTTWENENLEDSVRFKAILSYYSHFTYVEPDSVFLLADYHFNLATEKDSQFDKFRSLYQKSQICLTQNEISKALKYLKNAVVWLSGMDNPSLVASSLRLAGAIFLSNRNYLQAIRFFSMALTFSEENELSKIEVGLLNNLAVIHKEIGNYEIALEFLEKAWKRSEETGWRNNLGLIQQNMGGVKFYLGRYEEAITDEEKALELFKANNEIFFESSCYYVLAQCHDKLKNREKAKEYAQKCLKIDRKLGSEGNMTETLTLLGNFTFESDLQEATRLAQEAESYLKAETIHEIKAGVYQLLYKCFKAKGDFSLSLEMLELYKEYGDSASTERNKYAVTREALKNEFEIELYSNKLENQAAEARLKLEHQRQTFYIIGLASLILFLVFLYFRAIVFRNRRQKSVLIAELERLKSSFSPKVVVESEKSTLNRGNIEKSIGRQLNETDWKVLNILLDNPTIQNKKIAEIACMSVDGIGSSLRRMYNYFKITETKYKKIVLLSSAVKRSA